VSTYRIKNRSLESDAPQLSEVLASIYGDKERPLCLCREPGVEMYVAKVSGRFLIKRMPNTGSRHDLSCESYEAPAELSGLGEVLGSAIQEHIEEGITDLKLAFSLTRRPWRAAPLPTGGEAGSVTTDGKRLTLRGTFHYLWEQAGFHKWAPAMSGKRNWYVIRKFLLQAAQAKFAKGHALNDLLYIPESFSLEHKGEIVQRRTALMAKLAAGAQNRSHGLMLLIAEVKEIASARYGYKLVAKHLPDFHFTMNEDLYKRLRERFENELSLWDATEESHLILIGTFGVNVTGVAALEEAALTVVNHEWIPIEHTYDNLLIEKLGIGKRRFAKGLRYNLGSKRPLASVVLSDTEPTAVAMYIVPPDVNDEYRSALRELVINSQLASWFWVTAESELPGLPPKKGYQSQVLPFEAIAGGPLPPTPAEHSEYCQTAL
jgi:hypothetical protein